MHTNADMQEAAFRLPRWRMRLDGSKLEIRKGFISKDDAITAANVLLISASGEKHLESESLKPDPHSF